MERHDTGQGQLFYSFDLDEVVPADHLVREIDRVLQQNRHRADRSTEPVLRAPPAA
jgi:hypothetical protein